MCLIAWIRALITTLVLASYSPMGIDLGEPDPGHTGHLAMSLFIGRRTRVAASQQFDVANGAIHQPAVRRALTAPSSTTP